MRIKQKVDMETEYDPPPSVGIQLVWDWMERDKLPEKEVGMS